MSYSALTIPTPPEFTITAFMCVYNESDILPYTLAHLIAQGIRVYVIDNWSTDDSPAIARSFPLLGYERYPAFEPPEHFSLRALLTRIENLTQIYPLSTASWFIHHDADEIRRSPIPGECLRDAIYRVGQLGYNAIDHIAYEFCPVDESWECGDYARPHPETLFRHYSPTPPINLTHVKAWKNIPGTRPDLASNGGHDINLTSPDRRIYPDKFILKHYPIRSSSHASRKILTERLPRYDLAERELDWHVQYDILARTRAWIKSPRDLKLYR